MKICLKIICIFLISTSHLLSQNLVPFLLKNGRYSYVLPKTKNVAFQKQFDNAMPFYNGIAFVKYRSKWGAIDSLGKYVIQPQFDYIRQIPGGFIEGYSSVYGEDEYFSAFRNNFYSFEEFSIPDTLFQYPSKYIPNFNFVTHFGNESNFEDYAIVKVRNSEDYFIVNKKLNYAVKINEDKFERVTYNEGRAYLRLDRVDNYSNGFFKVGFRVLNSNSSVKFVNYLNVKGEFLLNENYYEYDDDISGFNNGLAIVKKDEKYGFIDSSRNEIIPLKYSSLSKFSNGVSNASFDNFKGYIDMSGRPLFPFGDDEKFEYLGDFNEGFGFVSGKNGEARVLSIIDPSGKTMFSINSTYQDNLVKFSNGKIPIYNKQKSSYYDVYDTTGKVVYRINFPAVSNFSKDGFSLVQSELYSGKYSLIESQKGREVFVNKYDKILFKYESKFCDRDISEYEILDFDKDFDFVEINLFSSGLIFVENIGLRFYVDKDGFEYLE